MPSSRGSQQERGQQEGWTAAGATTMIPTPRTGQFAADCAKVAKTEKNRLRLLMQHDQPTSPVLQLERDDGHLDPRAHHIEEFADQELARKERRITSEQRRPGKKTRKSSICRYRPKDKQLQQPGEHEGGDGETVERRRPMSLVVEREGVPWATGAGASSWRPLSAAILHSTSSTWSLQQQQQPKIKEEPAAAKPKSSRYSVDYSAQLDSVPPGSVRKSLIVSSPTELDGKSAQSYELDGSSTEEDCCPSSSLQFHNLSKTNDDLSMIQKPYGLSQSAELPAQQTLPAVQGRIGEMSFSTDNEFLNVSNPTACMQNQSRLGAKMDVVYSLLSMLGGSEAREDMSTTLLSMSNSVDSCIVMRQSGCLPLLIQLIHAPGQDPEIRERASRALYNIVHSKNDEKTSRRETRVLRLLEQLRDYCQSLTSSLKAGQPPDDLDRHPGATIAALMKLSFDGAHRHAMCQLGALHAVAELIEMDHAAHGSECDDQNCVTLRRYAGMALTNLTFGDSNNKALLCSFRQFMKALVSQLRSPSDDLRQVTASVLRNLSWRADSSSKQTLREVGAVIGLMKAAMESRKESTLKSVLSALWNLSAHCSTNKIDICGVEGALAFLVEMLSYNAPSKTLAIVENAGGILRNVSSHIAVRDDYRAIVRERGCLQVLLRQLRSPSLTVVSNACGALWNLSARCPQDQRLLWDLGAVPMLRSLVHSKHKMISMGSSAALKNLLSALPNASNLIQLDSTTRGLGLPTLPSLHARRQKALEQEIDQNLAETCDNIEPSSSPIHKEDKFSFRLDQNFLDSASADKWGMSFHQPQAHLQTSSTQPGVSGLKYPGGFTRSESRESMRSVTSTQSDTIFEKVNRHARNGLSPSELQIKQQSASVHAAVDFDTGNSGSSKGITEKKYTLRYMNAIPERLKPGEPLPDLRGLKCAESTISWAATPNQDMSGSKNLMPSSIEDNSSMINSCNSKHIDSNFESNSLVSRAKLMSVNCELRLKSDQKVRGPTENQSDDDKQSSAYFTSNEQDTVKTEDTPYQSSLNSSRTSSETDLLGVDGRVYLKNIPTNNCQRGLRNHMGNSFRSNGSSKNIATLEPGKSLESDSAIFEDDQKFGESSGVASLSSLDEPKLAHGTKVMKASSVQYEADTESFPDSMGTISDEDDCRHGKHSSHRDLNSENNLVRYKTNASLNDIQDTKNGGNLGDMALSSKSVDFDVDQQDDGDCSEMTQTNDYYTVQETYTLEKEPRRNDQTNLPDDDFSTCQTLSFMSVDDRMFNSKRIETESAEYLTGNLETAVTSPSDSCGSFNTIEKSEQVLLELCMKSGMSKDEPLLSCATSYNPKSRDVTDTYSSKFAKITANDRSIDDQYRRQRDPDAMIASLDRLTATLVQQSEAMREGDSCAMKGSLLSDTWTEDSPNDVSFPSISVSAPLPPSFKSDVQDYDAAVSMTDSKIIEREAIKLAEAVSAEVDQSSLTSIDLDAIKPPSTMGSLISLTASIGGMPESIDYSAEKSRCQSLVQSEQLFMRKKSLPIGVVARRALCQGQKRTGSLENLLNECNHSQLENVKPPSIMDDLMDVADMENSMLSVASITSEIADSKENSLTSSDPVFDLIKPLANVLSITCMRYADTMQASGNNSLSDCLENINPPSLFNEVSQLDESTVETNTLCIDAELETEEATNFVFDERIEEIANDTDDGVTPISSECCSSLESTPKKLPFKSHPVTGYLTPKQKRELAKERYKTYTIAAEREKKEQEERKKQQVDDSPKSLIGKPLSKLTPKQRRQEDRARFQTQVLQTPVLEKTVVSSQVPETFDKTPNAEKASIPTPAKTGIPMFRKFGSGTKIPCSKTPENQERYRARTLNDDINLDSHESRQNGVENTSSRLNEMETSDQATVENSLIKRNVEACSHEAVVDSVEEDSQDENSQSESEAESCSERDEEQESKKVQGPRIVKPVPLSRDLSLESDKSEPELLTPKPIRGRRKPLYSAASARNSTQQSSPLKQPTAVNVISRSNSSPLVRATRATTLRQHNSLQKAVPEKRVINQTPSQPNKRSSIPQKASSLPNSASSTKRTAAEVLSFKPLERQGTFTKDEPEMENAPTVAPISPYKCKIARPTTFVNNKVSPKTSPIHGKSKISMRAVPKPTLNKLTKTKSVEKISSTSIPMMAKRSSTNLCGQVVKSCSNNQISSSNETGIPRKVCLGPRSNSNSSIVSNVSNALNTQSSARNKMVNDTSSKIASLWKKVEENKNKQRYEQQDTRQWITPKRPTTQLHSPQSDKQQTCSLLRSSTFGGVTHNSETRDLISTKLTTV